MSEIRNCNFRYECTKKWEDLMQTYDKNVRHCINCHSDVHYCRTQEELYEAMVHNYCVAVEIKRSPDDPIEIYVGDVAPPPYPNKK